jgi:iron complex outermembrane receptor protein
MKQFCLLFCACSFAGFSFGQSTDTVHVFNKADTLQEVTVAAFNSRLQWKTVPAAVAIIGHKEMDRYAPTSLVPVYNTVPGVRMEERSPASYRLSFRGSLLRSPFGVRNIKVYWNGIPLSDGGGNTYLNLVDMNQLTGSEIVKGPAASVYGAGTGGVLLLNSALNWQPAAENHFTAGLSAGSYGLFQEQLGWTYTDAHVVSQLQQAHQQADGYRQQSASRRDVIKWQGGWQQGAQNLRWLFFYTDLYYQTPGGITLAQMQTDPRLARQPAGTLPGAVQQQTAIYNKTIFGGLQHEASLGKALSLRSFVMANHTGFTNPFITNYEERNENNTGIGTQLVWKLHNFQWINGAEWLYNHSLIDDYDNNGGKPGNTQFKDDVFANQWFFFSQAQYAAGKKWYITAGVSINNQRYQYRRTTDPASVFSTKNMAAVFTPRLAVTYRLTNDISVYAMAAKGFSPPALAELRPSDGNFYGNLEAEYGWNYEAGIKGELFDHQLQFDLAFYAFDLQNTIVRRNNAAGAEYFINAGETRQHGIEAMIKYELLNSKTGFFSSMRIWSGYSYQPYRFEAYKQGAVDYSGNALTGVPKNTWVSGIGLEAKEHYYLELSYNQTSSLPLTDANDVYADAYHLMQLKLGYRSKGRHQWHVFGGIDNLLSELYSLGNDINAAGKRYYNPAAGRNIFAGLQLAF